MSFTRYILLAIPFVLILATGISHGFLPPDNINYLTMADTVYGTLCYVGGEPFGLFPCGYPLAIKGMEWLTGLSLFHASKILNILALIGVFFCFRQIFKSIAVPFWLTFNPFSIQAAIESGAEILFLFAFALYCLMLHFIKQRNEVKTLYFLGVLAAIAIGCFSRYMFAPFSVLLFLASLLLIQHKMWKLLPAFVISAALFVLYRLYLSEFDMERVPSPESQLLIFFQFIKSSIKTVAFSLPPILVWGSCLKKNAYKFDLKNQWAWFLMVVGLSYLAMILLLRSLYQFDFFGIRFVGFGYMLVIAALLLTVKQKAETVPLYVFTAGMVAMYLAVTELSLFRHPPVNIEVKQAIEDVVKFKKQDNAPKDYALVVTDRPWIHPEVAVKGVFDTWQNGHIKFLPDLPYQKRYEMSVVEARLSDKPCKIYFDLEQDINDYVTQKYRTGLSEYQFQFSKSAREYLLSKYKSSDDNCF